MMNFDIEENLSTLRSEGVLIHKDYVDTVNLLAIKNEIYPWLSSISFNSHISSSIIGNNQWIEHLGLCSAHALETILNPSLISFAEQYLGSDVCLGSLQFQRKIFPESGIPMHRDHGEGIYFFIFLNDVKEATGATSFVKKSHHLNMAKEKLRSGETSEIYMDESFSLENTENLVQAYGGPGTMVVWDRRVAHELPSFKKHGRDLIMASLLPKNNALQQKDHLLRSSFVSNLSNKQRQVIFSGTQTEEKNSLLKLGEEQSLLDDYKISRLKMFIYYFRFRATQIFRNFFNL
jgi:hypothetical protein